MKYRDIYGGIWGHIGTYRDIDIGTDEDISGHMGLNRVLWAFCRDL